MVVIVIIGILIAT
ncbi:hypothetical protein IKO18_03285 [bacterium]|nr:hypothetical protein [bacterium]